jgi:isoleucyl-tRNA synthetase
VAEGQARELVRSIQDARKAAGLAIADRITVTLDGGDAAMATMLAEWGDYVRAETLATTLEQSPPAAAAHVATLELDGRMLTIGLSKAE